MPSRTDEAISKGMGAVKSAKAFTKGLVGVFKTLMKQHGEVSALLRRVQSNEDKRADLWPKIRHELLSHEGGEVRVVYPALSAIPETRDLADRHQQDADRLEAQIERLQQIPIASAEWGQQFDQLVTLVEQHVAEEESEIFPRAQEALGEDRARELEAPFMAAKQSLMAS